MLSDASTRRNRTAQGSTPVCRPRLPGADALLPYLRRIEASGWYSNFGPLEVELTRRLADHLGLAPGQTLLTGSGTVGLSAALMATARPGRNRCLMPSWTFVAGVGATLAARLTPYFCDVSAETWALDAAALSTRDDLDDVAAVMVTCPFGEAVDVAAWDEFSSRTGVPVVIDAAAAFGALDARALAVGRCAMVVSLHATKTLGVGEGGLLLSRDDEVVGRAAAITNFGFHDARIAQFPGVNGKMSEFTAAVGHAALDRWTADRVAWSEALDLYAQRRQRFARSGVLRTPLWPTSTVNWVAVSPSVASDAERALAEHGIDTRRWWGGGCHTHVAYQAIERDRLTVTEDIAARCIGLPMWQGLEAADVDRMADVLANLPAIS
jgi:dTDP-4-amino-4,6-dideoxygalactose transaminase